MNQQEVPENNVQEFAWQLKDNDLASYVNVEAEYTPLSKTLSWFNLDLNKPMETEQEIQERNVAIQHQVQLGILKVVQQPQPVPQQGSPKQIVLDGSLQPPKQALPPEIIESMQIRLFPGIIIALNGKEIDLNDPQPVLNAPPKMVDVPNPIVNVRPVANRSIVDEFVDKANKYKFNLNGSKVGRNDPCPCGSGRKHKLCHGH